MNGDCTTLDNFFADKTIDYVKADIEGAEVSMLQGAPITLAEKIKTVNICVYHNPDDEEKITGILQKQHFQCVPNRGYLFFSKDNGKMNGFLRRGVIYATK